MSIRVRLIVPDIVAKNSRGIVSGYNYLGLFDQVAVDKDVYSGDTIVVYVAKREDMHGDYIIHITSAYPVRPGYSRQLGPAFIVSAVQDGIYTTIYTTDVLLEAFVYIKDYAGLGHQPKPVSPDTDDGGIVNCATPVRRRLIIEG